ncbi:hypothetical protein [Kamptonema formosum]|nr:hypothetical protein [Oscillatoria sp. PCC 10802]
MTAAIKPAGKPFEVTRNRVACGEGGEKFMQATGFLKETRVLRT